MTVRNLLQISIYLQLDIKLIISLLTIDTSLLVDGCTRQDRAAHRKVTIA